MIDKCPNCYGTGMMLSNRGSIFPCQCQTDEARELFEKFSRWIENWSNTEAKVHTNSKVLAAVYRIKASLLLHRAKLVQEISQGCHKRQTKTL